MLLLAYSPCMRLTIRDIALDNCNAQPIQNKKKICKCTSNNTAQKIYEDAQIVIPGFTRTGFLKEKSVADPLGYVLGSENFEREYDSMRYECVRKYQFQ